MVAWGGVAFWNSVKPLPSGVRAMSLPARLSESELEFVTAGSPQNVLARTLGLVEHAEQLLVIDQSPLPRAVAQALLLRKHLKPHLKIVVIVDPAPAAFGGTPPQDLQSLERQGIIVARVRLERLRDANPLYSALWRMSLGWWSDPFDEAAKPQGLAARLRRINFKLDRRQMLIADDGAGGWVSLTGPPESAAALLVRGAPAQDILAAELSLASWSDEDRLPPVPPTHGRGFGTIDARFLTESAISAALQDSIGALTLGDSLSLSTQHLGDRNVIAALGHAAGRGVTVQLLLDVAHSNLGAAGELHRADRRIAIRWAADSSAAARSSLTLIHHGGDVTIYFGSAYLTRSSLADFNLESVMELRAPAGSGLSKACTEFFAKHWAAAFDYARYADDGEAVYWSYRFAEATGLAGF